MNKVLLFIFVTVISFQTQAQAPFEFRSFDLNTGVAYSNPRNFFEFDGKLYFSAFQDTAGYELWVTDGTAAGTKMLKDLNPGIHDADPRGFITAGGKLFFTASNFYSGVELYVTDGSDTGTKMLKDIFDGGGGGNTEDNITVLNGKLIFSATDISKGAELWTSDGTEAGTKLLKDIRVGLQGSYPSLLIPFNGSIYFTANDGTNGNELWVTDGTTDGTKLVKNIHTGSGQSSNPMGFIYFDSKLVFTATTALQGRELWMTDGTTAGTNMIVDFKPGTDSGVSAQLHEMIVYNNKLYFAGFSLYGYELCVTDGTPGGTTLITDIFHGGNATPHSFCIYNGKLYFNASDSAHGTELWVTDGTEAGTKMVKEFYPGKDTSGNPKHLFVYKNFLFLTATVPPATGLGGWRKLFKSDGTEAGTVQMTGPSTVTNNSPLQNTTHFYRYDSTIYFAANFTGIGNELWAMEDTTVIPSSVGKTTGSMNYATLYPNPTKGSFTVALDNTNFKKGSITVYNILGASVYQSPITNRESQITLNQPAGTYLVKLQLDDASMIKRLVIE